MPTIKQVKHIAIVVEDIDSALRFWRDAMGLSLSYIKDVPEQESQVALIKVGENELELVEPINEDSGVARFLKKRGPGMHHICFEVDDLEAMLVQLKDKGVRLINESPMSGVGGKKMAFIHPESANGVLVELYQM